MTNNFFRRWRQHIGDLKGGAKYTTRHGKDWYPICIIDGFDTMREACQCEWKLKHNKKYKGPYKRIQYTHMMIREEKWTSKSPIIKNQNLTVYIDDDYKDIFQNYPSKQLYWK